MNSLVRPTHKTRQRITNGAVHDRAPFNYSRLLRLESGEALDEVVLVIEEFAIEGSARSS